MIIGYLILAYFGMAIVFAIIDKDYAALKFNIIIFCMLLFLVGIIKIFVKMIKKHYPDSDFGSSSSEISGSDPD